MSVKKDREDLERLEREKKIRKHLAKTETGAAEPKADSKVDPKADPKAQPGTTPAPTPTRIYPPLQPWERIGAFGRREQFRPKTRAEHEAVQDAWFLKNQYDADQVHREKIRKAEGEAEAEQKAARKRAEQEVRTGMRPYDPGRYCSVEEAIQRGYVADEPSSQNKERGGDEWSSAHNPQGIMGGGGRR